MENKKVYIITGAYLCSDDLGVNLSNYCVKSTLEKAKEELRLIKKETIEDLEENDVDYDLVETEKCLKFYYDNDDIDIYEIFERNIDEECNYERN